MAFECQTKQGTTWYPLMKKLMQLGGELMIITSVIIGHKIYLVMKAKFLKMRGKKSTFVPFGKIRCNKIHDAPLASTSKAILIYVSNSLCIPSYLVESLHTILKKMINIELAKKDMVITKLRMENQCTKLHLPSQGRHPTY